MTSRSLRELLSRTACVEFVGDPEVEITQVTADSRLVQPGALFFALPGARVDGARFIEEALRRGASAVVASNRLRQASRATLVMTRQPRRLLGRAAGEFYDRPSDALTLVGITGTSGKTSTTYLLEAIGHEMGWSVGVIGTINYRYGDVVTPAPLTTPGPVELQALLRSMVEAGVSHVFMEVSSHALSQDRVHGCSWDGAVFTNLGRDHLDFHTDLDDYFTAKSRLFYDGLATSAKPERFAAINGDDPWGAKLLARRPVGRTLSYGYRAGADVLVRNVTERTSGVSGILSFRSAEEIRFSSALIGEPHVSNIVAASTVAYALGASPHRIAAGIARCAHIPGRLERIAGPHAFQIVVDYAHKPDALERTLASLRRIAPQRLCTVFGCGGDRDRGKRPLMGEIAGRLSDVVVLTSDNPRTEDPWQILAQTEVGLARTDLPRLVGPDLPAGMQRGYLSIADRRSAIRAALSWAQPGDVVVIAGKGHEEYQILGSTRRRFDDREEIRQLLGGFGNDALPEV